MTISSETRTAGPFTGNNVTTVFPFAFKVFAATDVVVVKTVTATEVESTLVNVTDYTVSLNADQDASPGGTVTLPSALLTGYTLTLTSDVPMLQSVDLTNQGGFYPNVINNALDRLTIFAQQLNDAAARAVKVPISSTDDPDALIASVIAAAAAAASSASAAAASAAAAAAAIPSGSLGYTPVNKVGDTMTGTLNLPEINVNGSGAITSLGNAATKTTGVATGNVPLWENIPIVSAIRQTVLGGPVDSSGYPAPGGSTGATSITTTAISASAPFVVGFANGFGTNGEINLFGVSTANLTWSGLSTNGTMYLYADYNAGALTAGSTTLAPVYQNGGTYSTTSGQSTFNITEMVMKVGNGASAVQTNRVFVGEVTVAAGVVSAIRWYAYRGRYRNEQATYTASTAYSFNHNIGQTELRVSKWYECLITEAGYAVGDRIYEINGDRNGTTHSGGPFWTSRLACGVTTGDGSPLEATNKTTGALVNLTAANWKIGFEIGRGW